MSRSILNSLLKCSSKHRTFVNLRRFNTISNEKNILTSVYKDLEPLNCTIDEFIWKNVDRWPNNPAAVCGITGRGYTYAQTHKMSLSVAAYLRNKLKLKPGDTVAIVLPNLPEYYSILLGIIQAGCVASTMNPVYNAEELTRLLEMVDCKAVFTSKFSYQNVKQALNSNERDVPVVLLENESLPTGCIKFSELVDPSIDVSDVKYIKRSPEDVAVIPFSSGTTGFPKGVVLTHRNLVSLNQMIAYPNIIAVQETIGTHQSILPAVLPFFHIFGLSVLGMNQMHMGCKLITLPNFTPESFLKVLLEHKPDCLFVVPPMAVFLGKHPAVTEKHLSSVRSIICGAAPLSKTDVYSILEKNKNIILRQGFGLTETTGGLSIGKNTGCSPDSVGHVMPCCYVKIADLNNGEALGPGQEGEIWFRGPIVMRGYYNNEAATKEVFSQDGWFKTGDLGKYDSEKNLYVTDRLKELIKVKGFQVPPAELEAVLRTHPKVLDTAVIGIPDAMSGELPKAFIVPQVGQKPTEEEILEYVNSKVTKYKHIHEVQLVDSIPKNAAGKILRKDLKKLYC